jgi:hypothetical protein
MEPTTKQGAVPTDRTPTNRNDCLAVAQALNDKAKTLSKRTKQGLPREFIRVASDLDVSCGEQDFAKAWISIEWMNGCLNNFTRITSWGSARKTKATLAHLVHGQTVAWTADDRCALVRGAGWSGRASLFAFFL